MIDIVINPALDIPIYQQLFIAIRTQIMTGGLTANTVLPPIRTLAKELGISVITVKKAWEELEHAGLIYTVTGRGSFVADLQPVQLEEKKNELLRTRMREDLAYYCSFGLSKEEIIKIIRELD